MRWPAVAILGIDVEAIGKEVDAEREAQLALKAEKAARRAEKEGEQTKPTLPAKGQAKPAATAQEKKPQRRRSKKAAA